MIERDVMTYSVGTGVRPSGLLSRPAAYSVIDRCLELQAGRRPRGWLARQVGVTPLTPEARRWFQGALGERAVAGLLESLGPDWVVLHSVPTGPHGADIDHLVIGPAGVFTITTAPVAGHVWVGRTRILVNGRREDFVGRAEREARRVHKRLSAATGSSVFVRPILVFVDPHRLTIRDHPAAVTVLTSGELLGWLDEQSTVYPAERVAELVAEAALPSTWQKDPDSVGATRRHLQRFERLGSEVAEADRRMRWTKLAVALTFAAVVISTTLALLPERLTELIATLAG